MLYPETPEMVMLFDFDSVMQEGDIQPTHLSCTDAWAAPEIMTRRYHEIGTETDIYGIGALLLHLLFHRAPGVTDRRRGAAWDTEIEASLLKTEKPEIKRIITEILSHTLAANPKKRYASCDDLLDVIEPLIAEYQKPKLYLKTFLPMGNNFFCGRDLEIAEIHEALAENDMLILHGIGGIGKSELAKHYAQMYSDDYDAAVFVRFQGNIQDTVIMDTNFPVVNCTRSNEEEDAAYFERKIKVLQEICTERHLLILDNFDTDDCDNLDVLTGLPCKILITSRVDFADTFPQYEVDVLDSEEALRSIITYYYDADLDDADSDAIDSIISAMQGHTMALELIGKHMKAMNITPTEMYSMLAEQGITASNDGRVRGFKDGNLKSRAAYAHIAALFNIFGLTEDMKQVLRNMALIGSTPFQKEGFINILNMSELPLEALESVIQQGWIQITIFPDIEAMNLHPLIGEVLCNELKPDVEHCEDMLITASATVDMLIDLNASQRQLEICWIDHLVHHIYGADLFLCYVMEKLNDKVYMVEQDYQNAEWCCLRIIDDLNALGVQNEYSLQVLDCYLNLQLIAERTGRPELQEKYLSLAEALQTPDSRIQMCARQFHMSYLDKKYEDAIQAAKEWMQIAEENGRKMDIGRAYHKMAFAEAELSNHEAAIGYQLKAAELLDECITEMKAASDADESDLVETYSYAGAAYYYGEKYESALSHYQKAIELTIAAHNNESAALMDLYVNIARVYAALDNECKCISSYQDATEIAVNIYGETHPQTISLYDEIATSAMEYADEHESEIMYEEAADYRLKQYEAEKESNGETCECAEILMLYAVLMRNLNRKSDALNALRKIYQIYSQLLEKNAENWGDYYYVSACILYFFDEKEKAEMHIQKAIALYQQYGKDDDLANARELLKQNG